MALLTIIPLDVWRRRVALVRQTVFRDLTDADLYRLTLESLDPAFHFDGGPGGASLRVYRLAYAAERRARARPPVTAPARLVEMDFSL